MDAQSKGTMLTRRKLLALIPAAPLLLSACHEQPGPQDPKLLPDQEAFIGVDMAPGPDRWGFTIFRLDPEGVYRLDDDGWTKISEAM